VWRSRHLRSSLHLTLGQGLAQVLSALAFLILARTMGVEDFGHVAQYYSAMLFGSILVDFGSSTLAVRELQDPVRRPSFAAMARARAVLVALVAVVTLLAMGLRSAAAVTTLLVVCGSAVTAYARYASAPLRAVHRFGALATFTVFERGAFLVGVAVTATLGQTSVHTVLLLAIVSSASSGILLRQRWGDEYTVVGGIRRLAADFRASYRRSRDFGVTAVAMGVQSLDSLVVGVCAGPTAAGAYAAVGRWTQPMGLISQALSQSGYAEMASRESDRRAARVMISSLLVLGLAALPLLVVAVLSGQIVELLLGSEFSASAGVLRVLSIAVIFTLAASPFHTFLQARGSEAATARIFVLMTPVQLLLMGILAWRFGAVGASWALLAGQSAMATILVVVVCRKLVRERGDGD
jgi:O-antigen/teichoic acid export membrane protein